MTTPHVRAHGMEVTYCGSGLVKVNLGGQTYELPNSYEMVKALIHTFGPFSHSQDVHYAAALLTLEVHHPTRQRTADDQEIINRVNRQRFEALNQTV